MEQLLVRPEPDASTLGERMHALAARLYPLCRSLTGDGVRETLAIVRDQLPIETIEVPTGETAFDWQVPREWRIRDAYVKDASGRRRIDFRASNLHVVGYSRPVHTVLPLAELKTHIFTLPDQPDLIPYRTSYYAETWGFCMAHREYQALEEGDYEVVIDSEIVDGSMSYGELLVRGETEEEVLLSAHICHPSLANDNCSGIALLAFLGRHLRARPRRFGYRIILAPGTIGAITWLSRNRERVARIKHGLVVSCVGDGGGPTYKKSRRGNALIDRAMQHVLRHEAPNASILEFSPYGYDERQYCSLGFDLPVGLFQRSLFGTFPEYHTSADNLDFIRPEHLQSSFDIVAAAIDIIENDRRYLNLNPFCEPQLGRRGLYGAIGGDKDAPKKHMAMLWLLNLSDGAQSLLDIAERAGMPFATMRDTAVLLEQHGLLQPLDHDGVDDAR
jgi:aminopeptidase-like protein